MPTRSSYGPQETYANPTRICPQGARIRDPRDPRRSHTDVPTRSPCETHADHTRVHLMLVKIRTLVELMTVCSYFVTESHWDLSVWMEYLNIWEIWNDYCYCDIPIKSVEILFYCNQINSTINRHNGRISLIGKETPRRDKRNSADKGHLNSL